MLLGKLRAAGKRYSRHAWRRKRTGSMQADVVWDGRGGCEVRQVAAMGCQKLCHPKSKDLRTPNYPTPSSPLSRLQPYVLPSESAAAQPPSRCAVAAAALIRDAARIATSEQSRQRAPPQSRRPPNRDTMLGHRLAFCAPTTLMLCRTNATGALFRRGILTPHAHPLHN